MGDPHISSNQETVEWCWAERFTGDDRDTSVSFIELAQQHYWEADVLSDRDTLLIPVVAEGTVRLVVNSDKVDPEYVEVTFYDHVVLATI